MHVAFYSPSWPAEGATNGIVSYVQRMSLAMTSLGHDVSVVTSRSWHRPDGTASMLDEVGIGQRLFSRLEARLTSRAGTYPQQARRIAQLLTMAHRLHPLDVVEMEESFGWAGIVQRRVDVPVVIRLHGPHFMSAQSADRTSSEARIRAEGRAISEATALTSPSRVTLDATTSRYKPATPLTAVIPNPCPPVADEEIWSPMACDPWRLLWVGRIDYAKGADVALRAFTRLAPKYPRLGLTMVGPDLGLAGDDGVQVPFAAWCSQHLGPEIAGRIEYLGTLSPAQILRLRRDCFLAFISSRSENFPSVALEAFASGSPVVSTDCGGVREIIEDGRTGLLVENESDVALAEGIERMLLNRSEAAAMAEAGLRKAREQYSVSAVGRRTADFFDQVIRGSAHGRSPSASRITSL